MKVPSLLGLDGEQQAVIGLPFHGRYIITGPAGAGKSVSALYRAWSLATTGRRVALLTRFNLLHQYLAQVAPSLTESVHVTTYNKWMNGFWRNRFHRDPPQGVEDAWAYHWSSIQRDCIRHRVRSTTHLVIDEGQNLPVEFYQFCHILDLDVTVFADENQPIKSGQSTVSEIAKALVSPADPLTLRENHRNSRQIAELAAKFHEGPPRDAPLPHRDGRTATVLHISDTDSFLQNVARYFNANREQTIGIICRTTHVQREIHQKLAGLQLDKHIQTYISSDRNRGAMDFSRRPIRIVTTASMKGLEFDTVFVPDLDAYAEDPTSAEARLAFLVLCTRAREEIYFAHRGPREPAILSGLPEFLLARRPG
ncbi:hypothetical protein [Streptomyces boncukensis]|uniref:Uncharacterized protein n=1 Tax=Streptomyces boncukensis TaxID=2711219 RepID=A0A6G4WW14_9ACTN|nr:hypothetical protein [Streptomyces boncukensis]NGO68661.1 hypothetical protein [Streptomyces boncukensis]